MAPLVYGSESATETVILSGTGTIPPPTGRDRKRLRESALMRRPTSLGVSSRRRGPTHTADSLTKAQKNELYDASVKLTEGFYVPNFPKDRPHYSMKPINFLSVCRDNLRFCCRKAIRYYKENEGIPLKLVDISMAMMRAAGPLDFYVTFAAKDPSGVVGLYETMVENVHLKQESKVCIMRRICVSSHATGPGSPPRRGPTHTAEDSDSAKKAQQSELYLKMAEQSEGFDVPTFPNRLDLEIKRIYLLSEHMGDLKFLCKMALRCYEEEEGIKLRLSKISKANLRDSCPPEYYITFSARDQNGKGGVFETKVKMLAPKEETKVEIIRQVL